MRIIFYKNTSNVKAINKNIEQLQSIECIVKNDSFDIFSPVLNLSSIDINTGVNYCFIEETNRYYFIDKIEHLNNQLIKLSMSCDFLMSNKNTILNGSGLVTKSENNINDYATTFDVLETKQTKVVNFSDSNKFTDNKLYFLGVN